MVVRSSVSVLILAAVGAACSNPQYAPYGVFAGHDIARQYPGTDRQARARAATEFHCPPAEVTLRPELQQNVGADTYFVSACGKQAVYTCIDAGACIREPLSDDALR